MHMLSSHYYVRRTSSSTIVHINKLLRDINYIAATEKWIKHLLNLLVLLHRCRHRFSFDSFRVVFFSLASFVFSSSSAVRSGDDANAFNCIRIVGGVRSSPIQLQ